MWRPEHLVRRHLTEGFFPRTIFKDVQVLKQVLRDWVEVQDRMPLEQKKTFKAELEVLIHPPPRSPPPLGASQVHHRGKSHPQGVRCASAASPTLAAWEPSHFFSAASSVLPSMSSPPIPPFSRSSVAGPGEVETSELGTPSSHVPRPLLEKSPAGTLSRTEVSSSLSSTPFRYRVPMKLWLSLLPWDVQRGLSKTNLSSLFGDPSSTTVNATKDMSSLSNISSGAVENKEDPLGVVFHTFSSSSSSNAPASSSSSAESSSLPSSTSTARASLSVPIPGMLFVLEVPPLQRQHGKVHFWSGAITAPIDVLFFRPFSFSLPTKTSIVTSVMRVPLSSPQNLLPSSSLSSSSTRSSISILRVEPQASGGGVPESLLSTSTTSSSSFTISSNSTRAVRMWDLRDRIRMGEGPVTPEVAAAFFPSLDMLWEVSRLLPSALPPPLEEEEEEAVADDTMEPDEEEAREEKGNTRGTSSSTSSSSTTTPASPPPLSTPAAFPPFALHDVGYLDPFPSLLASSSSSSSGEVNTTTTTTTTSASSFSSSSASLCHHVSSRPSRTFTDFGSHPIPAHVVLECPRYMLEKVVRTAYQQYRYYNATDREDEENKENAMGVSSSSFSFHPLPSAPIQETVEVSLHISPSLSGQILSQATLHVGYKKALEEAVQHHMREGTRLPSEPITAPQEEQANRVATSWNTKTAAMGVEPIVGAAAAATQTPPSIEWDNTTEEGKGDVEEVQEVVPSASSIAGCPSSLTFLPEDVHLTHPSASTATTFSPSVASSVLQMEDEGRPSHRAPSFLHPLHPRVTDPALASRRLASPYSAKKAALYPLTHPPPSHPSLLRPRVDYELIALAFRLGLGLDSFFLYYYERLLRDWKRELVRLRQVHRRREKETRSPAPRCRNEEKEVPPSAVSSSSLATSMARTTMDAGGEDLEEPSELHSQDIRLLLDLVKDPSLQFPEELGSLVEVVAEARGVV